uniref:Uncharacterized protein n=1 Tax=Kwoniella bestiolae CBS 10118 TaxID=1296100 RepID=A0A1B9G0U6_9TREE|nr:hypothetical protein I302_06108 [Kwoniella bestiolae CBS 10118]OCF24647.1 hypothetical protein I302_06108 [Kwoniella bestiolae CBS 10118]
MEASNESEQPDDKEGVWESCASGDEKEMSTMISNIETKSFVNPTFDDLSEDQRKRYCELRSIGESALVKICAIESPLTAQQEELKLCWETITGQMNPRESLSRGVAAQDGASSHTESEGTEATYDFIDVGEGTVPKRVHGVARAHGRVPAKTWISDSCSPSLTGKGL